MASIRRSTRRHRGIRAVGLGLALAFVWACSGSDLSSPPAFTPGPVPYQRESGPPDEALWILTESGAGYRVSAGGRVDRRFQLPITDLPAMDYLATDLAVGDGRLWIVGLGDAFAIPVDDVTARPARLTGIRGGYPATWHDGALWFTGNQTIERAVPNQRGDLTTETVVTFTEEFASAHAVAGSSAVWLWRGAVLTAVDGASRRDITILCRDAAAEDRTYTWAVTKVAMVYSCMEGLLRVVDDGPPQRIDERGTGTLVTDGHRTVWRLSTRGTGITDMTLMTSSWLEITAHDVGDDAAATRTGWTRAMFTCRQALGTPSYPAALAAGWLWVADDCSGSHRVVAFDPSTGAIRHDIVLQDDDQPRELIAAPNAAWVLATAAATQNDPLHPRRGLVAYRIAEDGTWTRTVIDPDDRSITAATAVQLTG